MCHLRQKSEKLKNSLGRSKQTGVAVKAPGIPGVVVMNLTN